MMSRLWRASVSAVRAPRAEAFTATNPVFSGSLDIEAGTGGTRVLIDALSSAGRIRLYDSTTLRGTIIAGTSLLSVVADQSLILEAGAGDVHLVPSSGHGVFIGSSGGGSTAIKRVFSNTVTWNPGSIAAFDQATTTVTVTGAAVGDPVFVSNEFKADDKAFELSARVTSANTVTLYLHNTYTGGALDPSSRTLRVVVMKF